MSEKFDTLNGPLDILDDAPPPAPPPAAPGFLPIETNGFDRLFISVVVWVALSLVWFRFIEPLGPSIWISNAIALALAALIISKG